MKVEFHGVRGSYPVPGLTTIKYGGNTTCVSVTSEFEGKIIRIIIDSGTGIISLGKKMVGNFFAKKENLTNTLLFTHLHPDHDQGFPFFAPNFFSNCELHLMGMKTLKKHIGSVLEQEMLPPTFPIEYKDLKSKRTHYEIKDGQTVFIGSSGKPLLEKSDSSVFKVDAMQSYAPSHPQQGAVYYRITELSSGKSVACIWDLESHYGGDKRVISFAKDCDIMIHDTQYTDEEYNNEKMVVQGFGHSTYTMAIDNATQANAKKLVCMHYNPNHTDSMLDKLSETVRSDNLEIVFSKENMIIEI